MPLRQSTVHILMGPSQEPGQGTPGPSKRATSRMHWAGWSHTATCSRKGCFSVWLGKHVLSIAMEEEGNCLSRYGSPQFVLCAPTQRPPLIDLEDEETSTSQRGVRRYILRVGRACAVARGWERMWRAPGKRGHSDSAKPQDFPCLVRLPLLALCPGNPLGTLFWKQPLSSVKPSSCFSW